jgi:predicted component of type VI protein secretion system
MVRLTLISGDGPNRSTLASRFPFVVGRDPGCAWVIEGAGVWARHATLELDLKEGFRIRVEPPALLSVNGSAVNETRLRNGDLVDLGAARIRFNLSEIRCRSFHGREAATWLAIGLLGVAQLLLIHLVFP